MLGFSICAFMCCVTMLPMKNGITAIERRPESLNAIPAQTTASKFDDLVIIKRIVDSYKRTASKHQNLGNSMWQMFFNNLHKPLHRLFLKGSINQIADILRNPHNSNLFYGFDNLTVSIQPNISKPAAQESHALICLDSLVCVAEAIGAIPLYNPEQIDSPSQTAFIWEADAIIDKISQALGVQLKFPNPYPYELGLFSSYGIISYRAPQAIYQAYRLKQILKEKKNPRVLEIGGGLGRTAYYARLLGIKDYTIVDIPFTAVSSAYFLGCALGDNQILLSGETAPDVYERIKILTPEEFLASNETYDLIFNADGFTEMDPKVASAYWNHIEKVASTFLSINHEINPYTVKMFVDASNNVSEVARFPYWMRKGYVEEIIQFK